MTLFCGPSDGIKICIGTAGEHTLWIRGVSERQQKG